MKKLHMIFSLFLVAFTTAWSQIPTDLTNTVRVIYRDGDMEPDYGVEYHYYKTNSQYIFLDYEERKLRDYTWSSDTGRLTKTFSGEYNEYTYSTASEGTCVFSEGSTGTFAIYDASWDLDHNGTPDGEQIDAGILPNYLHKQLGLATSGSSSFWLSSVGVGASDLSLAFSEQQIDVIASGNSPWGIVNAKYVSNAGEIDTLNWDNDWTVDVVMLNSVPVTNGGTDTDGGAINQAVIWLGLRTTAATYYNDGLLEIVISNHNGEKRIGANSDDLGDFNASLLDPPVGEVHIRLSYDSKEAELTSSYSYDGNQYSDLSNSSVAALQSYINRDPIAVELGAESDNVQIKAGENTFKEFVVLSAPPPIRPAISAGGDSSFYLDADGRVWAVGNNEDGQLGDGTKNTAYAPRLIMSDVKAISAGDGYTLILKMDSTVWATGENWAGQLGDGTQTDKAIPVKVMSEVRAISAGDEHSLFLKTDGTLWASGHNDDGQLGDGTKITRRIPVQIMADIQAMSAGGAFSIFLKTDGTVWASGENWAGQLGDGTYESRSTPIQIMSGVKAVAAGMDHGLYLQSDGSLWSVGGNWAGQLGDGTTTDRLAPIRVFSNVMAMAAGDDFSAIVTNEGNLFLAGDRGLGIQGIEPVQIMSDVQSVSAGADHLLILKNDGSIWAQGYNQSGALGSSDSPMLVKPVVMMTGAKAVDAGAYHSLILKDDDTAWSVGDNFFGALGDGTFESRSNPVKVLADVQAVATGENHSVFLKKDGSVWISGVPLGTQLPNDYDYLFQDYREQSLVDESPEQFMTDVKAIASGVSHCLFLKIDGSVWAAGANWSGQLGIGSNEDQASAVKVMEDVKAVAAGDHHSFFLKNDGSLWGAGLNDEGQLGDGTLTNRNDPVFIMNDVKALSRPHAGDHSLFLKTDGSVWGTGRNSSGELGIGSYLSVNVPTKVMDGAIDMAVGSSHSFYLKADKTLWASGANESGQMGNGSTNGSNIPILVMTNVRSMSCGEIHSLFLKEDGTVLASGNRYYGKLGDSYKHDEFTPVESFRILVQPSDTIVTPGGSTNFSVTATGTNLSYQWKKNGVNILNATGATLSLSNAQASDAASYTVVVSNAVGGVTSKPAVLAMTVPPPTSLVGKVMISYWKGSGTYEYHYFKNPDQLFFLDYKEWGDHSYTFSSMSGRLNDLDFDEVFILSFVSASMGEFTFSDSETTNDGGSFFLYDSTWDLDFDGVADGLQIEQGNLPKLIHPIDLSSDVDGDGLSLAREDELGTNPNKADIAPSITAQPVTATANQGGSVTFSVTATGTYPSYQWKKNGVNILNATGATLSLSNAQASDAASYTVTVSNAVGSLTSEAAALQVLAGGIGYWASGYTLSGGDALTSADPDKDGLNNALEYVLGGDPTKNDAANLAPGGVKSGSNFIFSFKRSLAAKSDPNTALAVEYGSNMTVWGSYPIGTDSSGPVVITSYDGASESVVVTIPTANAPQFFARLKATVTDSVSP